MKAREPRIKVHVPARMRVGSGWTGVCILKLSSRGLMASTEAELTRGTYVEVRRGRLTIIGRIVWVRDGCFGLRSQDQIDIPAVINEPRLTARPATQSGAPQLVDRRCQPRSAKVEDSAARAERSRTSASAFQFIAISTAGALGCLTIVSVVGRLLNEVSGTIKAALGG